MKLDDSWASLVGIDRVGFPDRDPIHMYATCVMFKCYHAIRNDYATVLDACFAHNEFFESHSKAVRILYARVDINLIDITRTLFCRVCLDVVAVSTA